MRASFIYFTVIFMVLSLVNSNGITSARSLKSCSKSASPTATPTPAPAPTPVLVQEPQLPCLKFGCTGETCTDQQIDNVCAALSVDDPPANTCWMESFAICERQANGECGWTYNDELNECNADYATFVANWAPPAPAPIEPIVVKQPELPCMKSGCIQDVCTDQQIEYLCAASNTDSPPENTCWSQSFAICERQANGECGWTENAQLNKCNADYTTLVANWTPPTAAVSNNDNNNNNNNKNNDDDVGLDLGFDY